MVTVWLDTGMGNLSVSLHDHDPQGHRLSTTYIIKGENGISRYK